MKTQAVIYLYEQHILIFVCKFTDVSTQFEVTEGHVLGGGGLEITHLLPMDPRECLPPPRHAHHRLCNIIVLAWCVQPTVLIGRFMVLILMINGARVMSHGAGHVTQ